MPRIVLAMIGSWGDLFPLIGLGVELRRRGHDVVVAAPPAFGDLVSEAGLSFAAVGRPVGFEEFRDRPEIFRSGLGFRHVLNRLLLDQIDEVTADVTEAAAGADLMVIHPIHLAAFSVAERRNIPAVVATVFPGMIPSAHTVPGGIPVGPWTGTVGRAGNRALWWLGSSMTGLLFDRRVNRHRRNLGLAGVRGALFELPRRAAATVVMAPEQLVGRPPDWPESVAVTSFVSWDHGAHRPVPRETEEFLASGPPPVLITLGSSTAVLADDFFEIASRAVLDHGERALVVTGPAPASLIPQERDGLHVTTFAPFGAVAPRCRAAIHHAGLGTTVAILGAGIPQLVVPRGFDQPDTAAVLAGIGVALTVPWGRRHRHLEPAIDRLLIDRGLATRAAVVARQIAGVDGAAATADVIERHLKARPVRAAGRPAGLRG
jgi:rhamnosyltransferase subunit B